MLLSLTSYPKQYLEMKYHVWKVCFSNIEKSWKTHKMTVALQDFLYSVKIKPEREREITYIYEIMPASHSKK